MSSLLEQQFRAKWSVWAALGAGCLVGVSGMVLIQRLQMRIEQVSQPALADNGQNMSKELTNLHKTLKELQEEIRQIKTRPPLKSALRHPTVSFSAIEDVVSEDFRSSSSASSSFHTASSNTPSGSSEFFSAVCSDDEDDAEEFFEVEEEDGEVTPKAGEADSMDCVDHHQTHNNNIISAERLSDKIKALQDKESQDLAFFLEVDQLMESSAEGQRKALSILKSRSGDYPSNPEFLWRLCKATYLVAVREGESSGGGQENDSSAKKQEMIFEAVAVGAKAIEADDSSSEAHKWYAISVGVRGEFLGIKEKILDGFEFKKHIDRASELAPNDHTVQHLLGRFCYEVAELSWWERKMAATLFADPPQATMEEARDHFIKAETLKGGDGWKENRQFLAKTYIHLKDYPTALEWLDKANEVPVRNPDDQQAQNDVDELLKIYENYR